MIWSKTLLVWSRLEIFVDSGQNQRPQYFAAGQRSEIGLYEGVLAMFRYWDDQCRLPYRRNLTSRD